MTTLTRRGLRLQTHDIGKHTLVHTYLCDGGRTTTKCGHAWSNLTISTLIRSGRSVRSCFEASLPLD